MQVRTSAPTGNGVIVILSLCVVLVAFATQAAEEAHRSHAQQLISSQPTEVMHVCEGDTIWGIARSHQVDGVSTIELVQWLRERNGLSSACLFPGQALLVPSTSGGQDLS